MNTDSEFIQRHIGPKESDVKEMLKDLGYEKMSDFISQVIPQNIVSKNVPKIGNGISEYQILQNLKKTMTKNRVFKTFLGMGFHDTITPTVIQRNVLENPVWYTAYTPYQAEIAQGRLEALLNFQTMVTDLTGMEISNASLLDEGTAAAEAVNMAHSLSKNKSSCFVASPGLHPHVIEVLKTRTESMGIKMILVEPENFDFSEPVFAMVISYPNTLGEIKDYRKLSENCKEKGALLVVDTDLLALTMLTPPGEWGADIVVGNTQRFGVPLGYGGPHAAFMATKDAFKRSMPGRLIGVSVDSKGKKALRLALQTREQHIRREKATSNICTAQVLLANMASFYAVYHGPKGLQDIAIRVHTLAASLAQTLTTQGYKVLKGSFFDTVTVEVPSSTLTKEEAEKQEFNFRIVDQRTISISINETTTAEEVQQIVQVITGNNVNLEKAAKLNWPDWSIRTSPYLQHPVFNLHHSETELLRYIHILQNKDLTLTHSMIPLGSCTMKLNATTELVPVSWPEVNKIHPMAPLTQTKGYVEMIKDLEYKLCELTGFAAVSLQPNAGSQGEYAGLLAIRKYHASRNQSQRNICLIPSSAHGTNPASAAMASMKVVVTACDSEGNVDLNDLKEKALLHKDQLSCLMITYPSTHGVFEASIVEICKIIHDNGGQVYMDGANFNALVGICRPGEFGPDVMHMNLHKTFSIPHGGGGPGVGPIGVAAHLKDFLPGHISTPEHNPKNAITATTSAPWGSASILPISWSYITMMGTVGIKYATEVAILNANYIAKKLSPYYPVLYKGTSNLVAHECILDTRPIKTATGIDVTDIAKRLIDYGFHAPTMSFPVPGTLMVEPTESESKAELDRFIEAMIQIKKEIDMVGNKTWSLEDNPLVNSPHTLLDVSTSDWKHSYTREQAAYPLLWLRQNKFWASVNRVDNAYGDKNIMCSCPPIESYQ